MFANPCFRLSNTFFAFAEIFAWEHIPHVVLESFRNAQEKKEKAAKTRRTSQHELDKAGPVQAGHQLRKLVLHLQIKCPKHEKSQNPMPQCSVLLYMWFGLSASRLWFQRVGYPGLPVGVGYNRIPGIRSVSELQPPAPWRLQEWPWQIGRHFSHAGERAVPTERCRDWSVCFSRSMNAARRLRSGRLSLSSSLTWHMKEEK